MLILEEIYTLFHSLHDHILSSGVIIYENVNGGH